MLLAPPAPTPYDLRFPFLGFPVRVSPWFWVAALVLGWNAGDNIFRLVWVACIFVSILIHEAGHGLAARRFGADPELILYHFGGLCVYDNYRETPWQRLVVLFSGPGAGFVLFGITLVLGWFLFGLNLRDDVALIAPSWLLRPLGLDVGDTFVAAIKLRNADRAPALKDAFFQLTYINLWWGLINLLPIIPLDGGRIAAVSLTLARRRDGLRWAYVLSLVTAGVLAGYNLRAGGDRFLALFFGLFALQSFLGLQHLHESARYGGGDWWER